MNGNVTFKKASASFPRQQFALGLLFDSVTLACENTAEQPSYQIMFYEILYVLSTYKQQFHIVSSVFKYIDLGEVSRYVPGEFI